MATNGKTTAPDAEAAVGVIDIGSMVIFQGYGDDVAEADRFLTEGVAYEVIDLPDEAAGTGYGVKLPNAKFNPKKPVTEANAEYSIVDVFEEEIQLLESDGDDGDLPIDYAYLESLDLPGLIALAAENSIKLTAAQKKSADSVIAVVATALGLEPADDEGGDGAEGEEAELPIDYAYLESLDKPGLLSLALAEGVKLTLPQKKTKESLLEALAAEFQVAPVVDEAPEEEQEVDYAYLQTLDKAGLIALATDNKVKLAPADKKSEATLVTKLAAEFGLEAPAPAPAAKAKPAVAAKGAAAKPDAKAATGKGKTTAPAAKAKTTPAPTEGEEEFPELENEDESVLALVNESADLTATAQDLESEVASNEYRLGGILFHLKKAGEWKAVKPEYAENGGWALFIAENFNVGYRKAQNLIDIYVQFTQAGIENPSEVVGGIGWTKASKLCAALAADVDPAALIEAAQLNTVESLSTVLKEDFGIGGTTGAEPTMKTRITLRYRYTEEQAKIVEDTLGVAAESLGGSPEDALFQILGEWAISNNVETVAEKAETKATPPAAKTRTAAPAAPAKPAGRTTGRATAKA